MRSKAHVKSHPLHPILVAFPIAFFTGTLAFDLMALVLDTPAFDRTAFHLASAGIITALAAAIPGLVDFLYVIPPNSSGKKRGARHGLLNVTVVAVFGIVVFLRWQEEISIWAVLALEFTALGLLSIAGWMGGTLVCRNQIGVDIRYAHAGKWKEEYFGEQHGDVVVARRGELKANQMKLVHFAGKRVVVARTDDGYAAFDDHCTHRGGSLAGGALICGTVQCPWHGSQFNVSTGEVKAGPANQPITTYPVRQDGDRIIISLPDH